MPTILTHLAVPLALGIGLGRRTISTPMLACGMAASVLPDLDVVAFRYGIEYAHEYGHRGASHSFLAAVIFGTLIALAAPLLRSSRTTAFAYASACYASHPLLDMLTDAGLGVALLWPWSNERFFASWRPIDASPLSLQRVLGERGWEILQTELMWVWAPAVVVCAMLVTAKRIAQRSEVVSNETVK